MVPNTSCIGPIDKEVDDSFFYSVLKDAWCHRDAVTSSFSQIDHGKGSIVLSEPIEDYDLPRIGTHL